MSERRRDSTATKAVILQAARQLFAERDIATVSIRDIAAAAGVSHGLVQRYFGSREQMLEEIVRQEVTDFHATATPVPASDPTDWDTLAATLQEGWPQFRDFAVVVARAELAGLKPERMLDPATQTPAARLADYITALSELPDDGVAVPGTDARIASAYVNAALFAFATMGPWLMASVGLTEADLDDRLGEILAITRDVITSAAGRPQP